MRGSDAAVLVTEWASIAELPLGEPVRPGALAAPGRRSQPLRPGRGYAPAGFTREGVGATAIRALAGGCGAHRRPSRSSAARSRRLRPTPRPAQADAAAAWPAVPRPRARPPAPPWRHAPSSSPADFLPDALRPTSATAPLPASGSVRVDRRRLTRGRDAFAADPARGRACSCAERRHPDRLDIGRSSRSSATRGLGTVAPPPSTTRRLGLVRLYDDGAVTAFVEKPPPEECDAP